MLMAIPAAVLAAGIQGGGQMISQGINAVVQGAQNKKQRKWLEKQAATQRQWALDDWAMTNEYNSPAAQMQRFKEAGLNPNLVYKQSNEAPAVRSSSIGDWNPRAPQFDIGAATSGALGAYYDVQLKQAQIDNLKTSNTVQTNEAALKEAQTIATYLAAANTGFQLKRGEFDLNLATELRNTTIEAAQANVDKIKADTKVTLSRDEREAAQNASNLKEAAERILNMRSQRLNDAINRAKTADERTNLQMQRRAILNQIQSLEKDVRLKELDINLKKRGVQPTDEIYWRVLSQILNVVPNVDDLVR